MKHLLVELTGDNEQDQGSPTVDKEAMLEVLIQESMPLATKVV